MVRPLLAFYGSINRKVKVSSEVTKEVRKGELQKERTVPRWIWRNERNPWELILGS